MDICRDGNEVNVILEHEGKEAWKMGRQANQMAVMFGRLLVCNEKKTGILMWLL